MKKLLSYFSIIMLAATILLTSCGQQQQAETEKEVPLKVTYSIDCSRDLLDLCDVVVTYKGDDGVDVIDSFLDFVFLTGFSSEVSSFSFETA